MLCVVSSLLQLSLFHGDSNQKTSPRYLGSKRPCIYLGLGVSRSLLCAGREKRSSRHTGLEAEDNESSMARNSASHLTSTIGEHGRHRAVIAFYLNMQSLHASNAWGTMSLLDTHDNILPARRRSNQNTGLQVLCSQDLHILVLHEPCFHSPAFRILKTRLKDKAYPTPTTTTT